jgi:hypothetical protein
MPEAIGCDAVSIAVAAHERVEERMKNDLERTRPETRSGRGRTRSLALLLVAAVLPLAACEGENMFTGDSVDLLPRVTSVSLPPVAFAGEVVNVRVDAAAAHGVSDLVVALRGAVVKDTTVEIKPPRSRLSQVLAIPVPNLLQDTLLVVEASVIDQFGNASRTRDAMTVVFGPPTITSVSAPTVARPGEPISVRVTAFGSRKISLVDMVARGAIEKDSTINVAPPRNNVTQDLVLMLPVAAGDTLLTLAVGVRDEAGQSSVAVTRTVPLAIEPPSVSLSVPATARAGLYLDLDVTAQATRQIAEMRVELRGAFTRDTVVRISPTQSALTQHIAVLVPGNITLPEVRVRAVAVDRGGAVAYSDVKTVTVPLGPPLITSLEVPSTAKYGTTVDVRVRGAGDRPLTRVDVRFRGAVDYDGVYTVSPLNTQVIKDASVAISPTPKDSVLVVSATVTDVSGAVSEIVSKAIPVTMPLPDTTDTTTVAALVPERPILLASGSGQVWTPAGAPASAPAYALPARRQNRVRTGRKRRF